jgi:hypothetical protein
LSCLRLFFQSQFHFDGANMGVAIDEAQGKVVGQRTSALQVGFDNPP